MRTNNNKPVNRSAIIEQASKAKAYLRTSNYEQSTKQAIKQPSTLRINDRE